MDPTREDLERANFDDLTAFWAACGASEHVLSSGNLLGISSSWPSRIWLEPGSPVTMEDVAEAIQTAGDRGLTLPWWPGSGHGITSGPAALRAAGIRIPRAAAQLPDCGLGAAPQIADQNVDVFGVDHAVSIEVGRAVGVSEGLF